MLRLLYVASVPDPAGHAAGSGWIEQDPHLIIRDGTHILDNDWWLNEETGTTFPSHVVEHLRRHPRRPASLKTETDPQVHAAWETKPTTVLLGTGDPLIPDERREWAVGCFHDARVIDSDHFILFRQSEAVANAVLDALADLR